MKNPRTQAAMIGPLLAAAFFATGANALAAPQGTCTLEDQKLVALDADVTDVFGSGVAVDGDTAVVGAPQGDDGGNLSGSAYVFVRTGTTWTEQQKLTASDAAAGDQFGNAVAISGDTLVVGAFLDDTSATNAGSAYVFVRSGTSWTEQQKLTAFDAAESDTYGGAVAVEGDTVFVGASLDDDGTADAGAAYAYTRSGTTWSLQQKIVPADPGADHGFGNAVSLSGDSALIGASADSSLAVCAGSAYVFARSGTSWSEQDKLLAGDGAADDFFGHAVSLDGDTAAVGAPLDHETFSPEGAAYVFVRSGTSWSEQDKLAASPPSPGDFLGWSVAVDGDLLAAGTPQIAAGASGPGLVYLFERSGTSWSELAELGASDGEDDDEFGTSVTLDGETLVVGALGDDDEGFQAGAAYVVLVRPQPVSYCTGKLNSLGCVPFLSTTGTASASSGAGFRVKANDVLPGQAGILIYGLSKGSLNFHGGKLCAKAPLTRVLPPKIAGSPGSPPCSGVLSRDFNKRIQGGADALLTIGQAVVAQWIQRDSADPAGFGDSLSNGVSFRICP